jgi:AraC-like DNA-binding protein
MSRAAVPGSHMLLSTDTVRERERLDYWRDIVCDTFVELECRAGVKQGFYGSIESRDLGEIRLARVTSTAQHVVRTNARIARSDLEYFFLSLQLHGRGCHKQDGRVAHLTPGDFAIYDTTRPYELLFGDPFSQLVLCLPREIVKSRLADAERLTACAVQGRSGSGRLASLFVRQLAAQVDSLDAASLPRLQGSVVDLIATALAEQRRQADPALSESRGVLIQRVLQFIEDHLGDPDLSCEGVAERHRISERYLRLLFEELGTCASDWIWRRRLERARVDLTDPRQRHLSVTTIGFTWGFKDAAHFSRAFKAQFGQTPSEARRRGG